MAVVGQPTVLLNVLGVFGIDHLNGFLVALLDVRKDGGAPLLIGSGRQVQPVVTPHAAFGHAAEGIVDVHVGHPTAELALLGQRLQHFVGGQPAAGDAVAGVVVEHRLEINLRLGRAQMDALHHGANLREELLGREVQASARSHVVRANHDENLGGMIDQITLQVVVLLRGVRARVAAAHDIDGLSIGGAEGFCPRVHVGDTIAQHDDTTRLGRRHGEGVIAVLAEGLVSPHGAKAHPKSKQEGKEGDFLHSTTVY